MLSPRRGGQMTQALPCAPSLAVLSEQILALLTDGECHDLHLGWLSRAYEAGGASCSKFQRTLDAEISKVLSGIPTTAPFRIYRGRPTQAPASYATHWTTDYNIAAQFGRYVQTLEVAFNQIDWPATALRRICWPSELEISLKPADPLQGGSVVHALAHSHARRIRQPFDRCYPVSQALQNELRASGEQASLIQLSGLITHAPDADPRWLRIPQASWCHYAVRIGNLVIDLTRRQFFPNANRVHIQPFWEACAEWIQHHHVEPVGG